MLLCFETPRKVKSSDQCGPYEPNMSTQDRIKFRAKHIKGADERIEIRTSQFGAETVIIIYKNQKTSGQYFHYDDHLNIRMSSNSKMHFTLEDWAMLMQAVQEAREILGI